MEMLLQFECEVKNSGHFGSEYSGHFGYVIHGQLKTNLFGQFERNTHTQNLTSFFFHPDYFQHVFRRL